MSETDGQIVPPRRRKRRAGMLVLLSVALLFAAGGLGFLALIGAPVEAPDWVTRRIEARLNDGMGGGRVSVGEIELTVQRNLVPRLLLRNVGLYDTRGAEVARLNEVGARVAARPLTRGRLELHTLRLRGAQITLRRLPDGTFDLSLGSGIGATGTLAGVLDRVDAAFAAGPLARMERIEAEQLTITLEDSRSARLWQVTEGAIVLENSPNSIDITVNAEVFNGTEELARTVIEIHTEKASPEATLRAAFENAAAADIAAQSPALTFLEVLDASISGSLGAQIGADGQVRGMSAALDIGAGVLQPTPEAEPIRIDAASARMSYDAEARRLEFEQLSLRTAEAQGTARGQAFLRDFRGPWPAALVAQFALSDVVVQPDGMFAQPMAFDEGALEFKLRLHPFSVEIGQLSLLDEGGRSTTTGTVNADRRGWNVALDIGMDRLSRDRLLGLWPVNVAAGTRDWVAANVLEGTFTDVSGAFRLNPEIPRGMLSLSYNFEGGTVTALNALPPIEGAAGYSSLIGQTFFLTLDKGHMRAPSGGDVDLAGSHMRVGDVTRVPGRAEITLNSESPIAAALALLDLPPFELMKKAELSTDFAEGRAKMRSVIRFDLKPKIDLPDVDYSVAGTLNDFASDTLVPGRALSAPQLELRANPTGIAISGRGRMGAVDANVVWSQQFGPEAAGESRVDGTVALGPAFLKEFGIALPEGSVRGEGVGSVSVVLKKGAPPDFTLVSDLNRLDLRLAALTWSKPVNRTGRLEVAGQLGASPKIDRLEMEAPGLSASGRIELTETGAMGRAVFSRVRVGGWLDGPVTLTGRGAGRAPAVSMAGGTVDLRAANFGDGGAGDGTGTGGAATDGGPMTLRLDKLVITEGIIFTQFQGQFESRGGLQGRFSARVNGVTPVTGSLVATPSGSAVRLISDDAGGAMAAAGVLTNARGGTMDLTLNPTGAEGVYDGRLLVRNTRVVRAPAITDILSAISIVGLIDQMNSGGITMTEVEAEFQLSPSRLTLMRSSSVGPSLGLSLDGIYDLATGYMDMQGVVSPVYFLNGIGQLFSRRGEGLFGFSFRMRGRAGDPSVSVNPLSILTPGMFREIFRRPPPRPG